MLVERYKKMAPGDAIKRIASLSATATLLEICLCWARASLYSDSFNTAYDAVLKHQIHLAWHIKRHTARGLARVGGKILSLGFDDNEAHGLLYSFPISLLVLATERPVASKKQFCDDLVAIGNINHARRIPIRILTSTLAWRNGWAIEEVEKEALQRIYESSQAALAKRVDNSLALLRARGNVVLGPDVPEPEREDVMLVVDWLADQGFELAVTRPAQPAQG